MNLQSLLILVPLLAVIILNLPFKNLMRKIALSAAVLLCLLQVISLVCIPVNSWSVNICQLNYFMNLSFVFDNLTIVLLISIAIVIFSTLLVGRHTIADENRRFNFINLTLICMIGMNGTVLVRDLFSLYVFIEVTSVSSFVLIAFNKEKDSLEGAFKYLLLSAIATFLMLASIAIVLMVAGEISFQAVRAALHDSSNSLLVVIAINLFIAGLLIKGGIVPFHGWLPDAYSSAPAAVSVLLAGIATKTSGIYSLIRLSTDVFTFNVHVQQVLMILGTVSIVVGALAALGQNDFKRMLAYSSISQVGYIVLSLGTGTPLGVIGAVFHLFNHAIFKSLLFVNSAAVEMQAGTRDISRMGGFASKMPITGGSSAVAFLSTAGIPPLSGFWSKLIIIIALWKTGNFTYAVIAVLSSLLTLAYFLYLQKKVFFGKLAKGFETLQEADTGLLIPELILSLIIIAVGIYFPFVLNNFILPIGKL